MQRFLTISLLLVIVLPIYGCKEGSKTRGDKNDSNSPKPPTAAPPGTAKCVVKEQGSAIECYWAEAEPESYFKRLFSPENAPNIGLFIVGLGGVIAAVLTIRAIQRQANIQAAGMRQWIDVTLRGSDTDNVSPTDGLGGLVESLDVMLHFRAANNTPYPLTVKKAEVGIARTRIKGKMVSDLFQIEESALLPPGRPERESFYEFFVRLTLQGAAVRAYADNNCLVSVSGTIFFEPAIGGDTERQDFNFFASCGHDSTKALGYWSKEAVMIWSEERDRQQNPN